MILTAKWLVENKTNFPWKEIVGAKVSSRDGRSYLVKEVTLRKWPSGPLLQLQNKNDLKHNPMFSIVGFESEALTQVEISADYSEQINKFLQQLENEKNKLDNSRQFDLLLFDLDNTLIVSDHLAEIRTKLASNIDENLINELHKEALKLTVLIPEAIFIEIKRKFPSIKFGIFTRAIKLYTEIVLKNCFPSITWDCLITNESCETKPSPEGISIASNIVGITELNKIALIGDDLSDIRSAYQSGIYMILFKNWPSDWNNKKSRNYDKSKFYIEELHSDAILKNPSEIIDLIESPFKYLLPIEAIEYSSDITETQEFKMGMLRTDTCKCWNKENNNYIEATILGKYFVSHQNRDKYNFEKKRKLHKQTAQLINSKRSNSYPPTWAAYCANFIRRSAPLNLMGVNKKIIISCIPFRPGNPKRLEIFINDIKKQMSNNTNIIFDENLLRFKDGVKSNKELSKKERAINIRDHLEVIHSDNIRDAFIFVVDDICTSGSSFYYASHYLKRSGASIIKCIALAKSVSS